MKYATLFDKGLDEGNPFSGISAAGPKKFLTLTFQT